MKRLFDVTSSGIALLLLAPLLATTGVLIALESRGGMLYRQQRIGRNGQPFTILKFRSMSVGSDRSGLLTVGDNDQRITRMGRILRKTKLDELPQLWNVLRGEMSIVGPRPEVSRYVDLYNDHQRQVLTVRPGLTDLASLAYIDENELLAASEEPEQTYIQEVMPRKLELSLSYIQQRSLLLDVKIILLTIGRIVGFGKPAVS